MPEFEYNEEEFNALPLDVWITGHLIYSDKGAVRDNEGNLISHAGERRPPVPWMQPR